MGKLLTVIATLVLLPTSVLAGPECRCLYQGKEFEQGALVCIHVDGRTRLARCEMLLNNSSWTFLSPGCPTAEMTPIARPLSLRGPRQGSEPGSSDHADVASDSARRTS